MSWSRALAAWLLIAVAETIHGAFRQLYVAPAIGDLPARQLGVAIGCLIILVIALSTIRWIGARRLTEQLAVGLTWTILIIVFEIALGISRGLGRERILEDYDLSEGGFMGFGLLFLLSAPALAARLRRGRGAADRATG